jgi:hypothetical protein
MASRTSNQARAAAQVHRRGAIAAREQPKEFAVLVHRAERNAAERDCVLDLLAKVIAIVSRNGSYMAPEDQATLRIARALLAEYGRTASHEL